MESSQLARSFEIFDESAYIRRDDLAQMNVAHEEDMFMERLVLPPPPPPSPPLYTCTCTHNSIFAAFVWLEITRVDFANMLCLCVAACMYVCVRV